MKTLLITYTVYNVYHPETLLKFCLGKGGGG